VVAVLTHELWGVVSEKQGNVALDSPRERVIRFIVNDALPVAARIRAKLTAAFAPAALDVVDESARHAGHAGARPGGESHFRIRIVSAAFAGVSRVERQRMVYSALRDELAGPVHALALTALAPEEAAPKAKA
jgi:BolA protein